MKDCSNVFTVAQIKLAHQRAHRYQLVCCTPHNTTTIALQPVMKDSSNDFIWNKTNWHTKGHTKGHNKGQTTYQVSGTMQRNVV